MCEIHLLIVARMLRRSRSAGGSIFAVTNFCVADMISHRLRIEASWSVFRTDIRMMLSTEQNAVIFLQQLMLTSEVEIVGASLTVNSRAVFCSLICVVTSQLCCCPSVYWKMLAQGWPSRLVRFGDTLCSSHSVCSACQASLLACECRHTSKASFGFCCRDISCSCCDPYCQIL